jgi:hypothetical protein
VKERGEFMQSVAFFEVWMIAVFVRVDVCVPAERGLHHVLSRFLRAPCWCFVDLEVDVATAGLMAGNPCRGLLNIGRGEGCG